MPSVKAFVVQLSKPEDVLKIQELLAEALQEDRVKDLHGIGCSCGNPGCDKRLDVHRMPDGRIGLVIIRNAEVVTGIILDSAGAKALAEKLQGA
jgi:formylmethanofuran:tetrahydromethanopterin formyltransferase